MSFVVEVNFPRTFWTIPSKIFTDMVLTLFYYKSYLPDYLTQNYFIQFFVAKLL